MIGVDEVGRGSWAGPLVVAAVRLHAEISGLTDSKLLSAKQRSYYAGMIKDTSETSLVTVASADIDSMGLGSALRYAFVVAIQGLHPAENEEIIIDGIVNYGVGWDRARCQAKADALYDVVSAASIVAKVKRDEYMRQLASRYSGYGFETNVGYGTSEHRAALQSLGVCAEHRRSFKPIKQLL